MGVFAFCVSGGGSRRSNPSRDTGSKRLRNPQDEAPEGSNAPKRNVKTTASKYKEPSKGMDEIPLAEFVSQRKINPYANPHANFRGNELFWTKQQNLIYLDVIKPKQNTNTSILHHAFISIFIALWAVISRYVTILMAILSYFTRFTMKRGNAGSWNSGLEKEQILETYSAQLQKS